LTEREWSNAEEVNGASGDNALDLLRGAGLLAPAPRALLEVSVPATPRLAWTESHTASHPESAAELAYLANAIVAGCSVQGRTLTEKEVGDMAVATCNLGLENWPSHWRDRDLVTAFQ